MELSRETYSDHWTVSTGHHNFVAQWYDSPVAWMLLVSIKVAGKRTRVEWVWSATLQSYVTNGQWDKGAWNIDKLETEVLALGV